MTSAQNRLRIVFAGTPDFAALHLQALLEADNHDVVAVYTQPDRPAGRGKKLSPSPVKSLALAHKLPVFQPETLKGAEAQQQLAQFGADIMVVVAYGLLLPGAILETPRLGCINVHASLLPRWRGAAPIQRAIEAGDTETGITIMQIDEGLDTGDMIVCAHIPIEARETGGSLHDKLAAIGPGALEKALSELAEGSAVAEKQDVALSNYAPKISKQEAELDWQQAADAIDRKVRAFNPFPVAYSSLDQTRIRIWGGHTVSGDGEAGVILRSSTEGIVVGCGEGCFAITELQLPGKKRLAVGQVLNAYADTFTVGTRFRQHVKTR